MAACLVLAVAVTAFAHGRTSVPGSDDALGPGADGYGMKMARYLDLSKEQVDKMGELRKKYSQDLRALRGELAQKRLEARNLFSDAAADEGTIMAKQKEMDVLRQKLRDDLSQLRLEQRRVLTPEQLKRLAELRPEH
jgi:Spy/CpxP family protein refolding chaperone